MGWTLKDIEKLKAAGTIKGYSFGPGYTEKGMKKSKYGNTKVEHNGMIFDSKKEFNRYQDLVLLERQGLITELKRQVPFELEMVTPDGAKKVKRKYIADHTYYNYLGEYIVEDVKSKATEKLPMFLLKKALMKSIHNIEIKIYK